MGSPWISWRPDVGHELVASEVVWDHQHAADEGVIGQPGWFHRVGVSGSKVSSLSQGELVPLLSACEQKILTRQNPELRLVVNRQLQSTS